MRCLKVPTVADASRQQQCFSGASIKHMRCSKPLLQVLITGQHLHVKRQGLPATGEPSTVLQDVDSESPEAPYKALSNSREVSPLPHFLASAPAGRDAHSRRVAVQAAVEAGIAVDAYSVCPQPPPTSLAEFGWVFALAVLCAARLSRAQTRADQFRPDLALVALPAV